MADGRDRDGTAGAAPAGVPAGGHLDGDSLCDYAEGLLAADARRAADLHLAACPDCRRELAAVQGYFQDAAGLKAEVHKAPDRFLTKVHARLDRASPWRRLLRALSSPRLLPVPLTALTLALLAGLTFHLSRNLEVSESAPVSGSAPEERVARIPSPEEARPRSRSLEAPREETQTLGSRAPRSEPAPPAPEQLAMRKSARAPAPAPMRQASRPAPTVAPKAADLAEEAEEADEAVGGPAGAIGAADESLALARGDREESKAGTYQGEAANLKEAPASAPASEPLAAAVPAPAKAKRSRSAGDSREGRLEESAPASAPGYAAGGGGAASPRSAPPSPQMTPVPWAPLAYTLSARNLPPLDILRQELASLDVRILKAEGGAHGRYELSLPATRLPALEARLRVYGGLVPTASAPARDDKGGLRLTVRLQPPQ